MSDDNLKLRQIVQRLRENNLVLIDHVTELVNANDKLREAVSRLLNATCDHCDERAVVRVKGVYYCNEHVALLSQTTPDHNLSNPGENHE